MAPDSPHALAQGCNPQHGTHTQATGTPSSRALPGRPLVHNNQALAFGSKAPQSAQLTALLICDPEDELPRPQPHPRGKEPLI
eukprot:CAMPEP_0174315960 /NCGR_PEP_ID=MMETSP0810-20121108/6618_1 /TAXON_ID=73025 ORGANISM="Eutreptiella gymnastica-like, Strain CCMP1594" /NCGR_SAMPLE_ID=MMETSP0810 /ASSEMBLY_ACC=CAM_ASM_000659 /LENGTH=82 /DNA_ID=CAMNT_0015425487 /DNA_START=378 /DNA_END=626 /DNA_ORIENTATION=-